MKTKLIAGFLLLLFMTLNPSMYAQWDDDEEEFVPPPRAFTAPKVGGAGGFTPVWLFWDVAPINEFVFPATGTKFDKTPMLLLGGGGYAYIMLIENLRVGGMGLGGSSIISSLSGGVKREVEVSVSFGGVSFEYALPLVSRLDVVPGIVLGGGGMGIRITRDGGGFKRWDDLWNEVGNNSLTRDLTRVLDGSFFVYQPSLHVEYALLRWLGLRVGGGYLGMSGASWQLDNQFDIVGVPKKIKGDGFILNAGLFVGTFLF